jgi:hypothetical protein
MTHIMPTKHFHQQPVLPFGYLRFFHFICAIVLLNVFCAMAYAKNQEAHLVLAGKVVDQKTHAPVAYASIGISGKGMGTISNEFGEFELFIPTSFIYDSLFISHLGYATFHSTVADVKSHHKTIYLKEVSIMLDDVLITANGLTAAEIIQKAEKNVKNNYPVREYKSDAFFREIRKENDSFKSLLEAAVSIYDEGYHKPKSAEKVYLQEVRTSKKYMNEFNGNFWNGANLFRSVLSLNAPRHPEAQSDLFDKKTNYRLTDIAHHMDRPVYILVSDTSKHNGWQRKIYIDTATYAIYRSHAIYLGKAYTWKPDNRDSVSAQMTFGESIQDYKIIDDRLYLSYIMHHVENVYFNTYTKTEFKKFTIRQYLVVNDVQTGNLSHPDAELLMKNYSLQSQAKKYNSAFWKNYNSIKTTPLEKKIIDDLEHERSLGEQFADPGNERNKKRKKNEGT